MDACICFDCTFCRNIVVSIPMLSETLYVNPINSVINKNSVPPISLKNFLLFSAMSTGVNVIMAMLASHTDSIAKNA